MMGLLFVIFCCGAFCFARANVTERQTADDTEKRATLEDEMDNQENIMTQVIFLGYLHF